MEAKKSFKNMCQRRYMGHIYEMKTAWLEKKKRARNYVDDVLA